MTPDPYAIRPHEPRTYRNRVKPGGLVGFRVVVKETDLHVHAAEDLSSLTRESVLRYRHHLEGYIALWPEFAATLAPWRISGAAPALVREMAAAGRKCGVGPMAAVAGAIAEAVGRDLLAHTPQVVVENGGDIFLKTEGPAVVGIYAGESPLSLRIALRIDSRRGGIGVCTSSGTVGHSLSRGRADAVCVVADCCADADAAATAIGNRVAGKKDITEAIAFGRRIEGLSGLVIIVGDKLGMWGDIELVPVKGKKG
jgi:ApbE superfamily uncharacterized protein (UPF0280 family)